MGFNLSILIGFFGLLLWSFAHIWRFPNILPTKWTTQNWLRGTDLLLELFYNSLFIGAEFFRLMIFKTKQLSFQT